MDTTPQPQHLMTSVLQLTDLKDYDTKANKQNKKQQKQKHSDNNVLYNTSATEQMWTTVELLYTRLMH